MEGPRITILHVVALIAVALIGAAVFFPAFGGGHGSPRTQCISNVKQVGTAIQIYLADFDDRFPLKEWQDEIYPYTKNRGLYDCSEIINEKKGKYGYAMNYELLAKDSTKIAKPDVVPVLFEIDALAPNVVANIGARSATRHKANGKVGGSAVGFADTHTKFFKAGDPLPK